MLGKTVDAIRNYRQRHSGLSLLEAKEAIEKYRPSYDDVRGQVESKFERFIFRAAIDCGITHNELYKLIHKIAVNKIQ